MNKRCKSELPVKGHVVAVVETSGCNQAHVGRFGIVTKRQTGTARPYTVKFNDGTTRKFRTQDVVSTI
jgi:hypothetical protein